MWKTTIGAVMLMAAAGCSTSSSLDQGAAASSLDTESDQGAPGDHGTTDSDIGGGDFGDSGDSGPGSNGGLGIGQGGAQDFGQFKGILDAGQLPGPNTIDDVGFFNEHKITFPSPDCGETVCLHGQFGTLENMIDGGNCTLALLGMNTPINPADVARPPLNLAVVVDGSGSMGGQPIAFVRAGLERMLEVLEPEDRVHLIKFGSTATLLAEDAAFDDPTLVNAISNLSSGGATNLSAGLDLAYDMVALHADEGEQNRIIVLSDGVATQGITDPGRLQAIVEEEATEGITTTTIGVGDRFDVDLMRGMSEVGGGAYYFLQDAAAVEEVFAEELSFFLIPLATDAQIDLLSGAGFRIANVYGTRLANFTFDNGVIDIPNLQLAHRTTTSDNTNGRRGGGGAIIVELMPGNGELDDTVLELDFFYKNPGNEDIAQTTVVTTPLDDNQSPEDGFFDGPEVEKAFVMLNIYVGFREAAFRVVENNPNGALAVLRPLRTNVASWLVQNADDDIADDLTYVDKFIANLEASLAQEVPEDLPSDDEDWLWD